MDLISFCKWDLFHSVSVTLEPMKKLFQTKLWLFSLSHNFTQHSSGWVGKEMITWGSKHVIRPWLCAVASHAYAWCWCQSRYVGMDGCMRYEWYTRHTVRFEVSLLRVHCPRCNLPSHFTSDLSFWLSPSELDTQFTNLARVSAIVWRLPCSSTSDLRSYTGINAHFKSPLYLNCPIAPIYADFYFLSQNQTLTLTYSYQHN